MLAVNELWRLLHKPAKDRSAYTPEHNELEDGLRPKPE